MEIQTSAKETKSRANRSAPSATSQPQNAVELFRNRIANSAMTVAARRKVAGVWESTTWREWDTASREIAAGLLALGIQPGDRICLLAQTRLEWALCDVGIVMAGAVTVPIYPSSTPEQCEFIITDSGAKVVIAEDTVQLDKLFSTEVAAKLAQVQCVSFVEDTKARPRVTSLEALRASGRAWIGKNAGVLEQRWSQIKPSDVFTIVYTSGTTGNPKGVVLTHSNICFELGAMVAADVPILENDEQLLFLPLAHIFAKLLLWSSIERGVITSFAEGILKVGDNMKEIRPTFMGSVPRIYEKVYAKIIAGGEQAGGAKTKIFHWAFSVGRQASKIRQAGQTPGPLLALQHAIAEKLVFSKIRQAFGGRLRFFISGGAPLSREIAEFFHAAGVLILEGYGLTETTAATHINRTGGYRFGTVGPALPGVEVRIADDGEILMRGANVMREYFGKPDATREVIDEQGWFHSGDIGVIEPGGFLRITDRKKDIIVTAGGKNIAPQNIEGAIKTKCSLISQVVVHGDKRPYLVALITLAEENLVPWARERGIAGSYAELTKRPEVRVAIDQAVGEVNAKLASYESIKKFQLLECDFSQQAGELTPTLKVKRKFASEKYAALIQGLYEGAPPT